MIDLRHGSVQAIINPNGAWVEELVSGDQAILFPKTELLSDRGDKKARGGMHVCLPNFGPGGDSGLPQHGYGRLVPWSVVEKTTETATLTTGGETGAYRWLEAQLTFHVQAQALVTELLLKNTAARPLRVAPGFHPYFHLDESETAVAVNDDVYELDALYATCFVSAQSITLKTANASLRLAQSGLPTWALWTDGLANYVCVEPTAGGYRFLEPATPEEMLTPGTTRTFRCEISF